MEDITNRSVHQRCSSIVERIKNQKKNVEPLIFLPKENTEISTKRYVLNETDAIRTARLQSYTNWPHYTPNREAMSTSGWFYCHVTDRVLCLYCNTICHQWCNTDDPQEVHQRLAPKCPFVQSLLRTLSKDSPLLTNENCNESLKPYHPSKCEISRRLETFNSPSWTQTLPSVNDLVLAGFFFSGTGNTVTCFYCNGSLHKWGDGDNPTIEHSRWFPNCIYARQLCGDRLHNKIQVKKTQLTKKTNDIGKDELQRLVNARLDLPVVERLRTTYRLSVIKRCIEDQFKNNQDDFASETDLTMACFILQKQIDIIQGNADKMIVPSQNQMSVNLSQKSDVKLEECLVCLTEDRQIACMPCGHLCTCVPCGYSLHSCPICRQSIQSFVRIYF